MSNTFGNRFKITLFGESRNGCIGAVLDGLPAGVRIDPDSIKRELARRRGFDEISTARRETDEFSIVSGVSGGVTEGSPVTVIIPNKDTAEDRTDVSVLRPSHADLSATAKYGAFCDLRGGGHFSGRLTAPIVAAGAIIKDILSSVGISVFAHLSECAGVKDASFSDEPEKDAAKLINKMFPAISDAAEKEMISSILSAKEKNDSAGGIIECAVTGFPAGIGEEWFDSVESHISQILFSIPAVKGVSFGAGFGFAVMKGSEANDPIVAENGVIRTLTNNNGGVLGGISNGMPIIFSAVIKPTPSVGIRQRTVNSETLENCTVKLSGRNDPCIAPRAVPVIESAASIALFDLLLEAKGTGYFSVKAK